ncbi:MAG TPA: hypothetical protein VGG27_06435 [Magnetospirillaceae bacterium]|jgi:hypothetical protein
MTSTLAVVTGSDATYFDLMRGPIRAIRESADLQSVPIYVFDAGLTAEQKQWLAKQNATIATPQWPHSRSVPGYVAMLAARPRIPSYFPGHEVYLWIDADAWPQTVEAVATYHRMALNKGFAVTPEAHPSYNNRELGAAHRKIRSWFGPEIAAALEGTAPINLGVFAGAAEAPHWAVWSKRVDDWLGASTKPEIDFNVDQTAFNMVVHTDKIDTALLPARYNWICHTSLPKASPDGRILLEPTAPFSVLGVVHMTLWTKKGNVELQTPQGGKVSRPLTYHAEPLPGNGSALPDYALSNLDLGDKA